MIRPLHLAAIAMLLSAAAPATRGQVTFDEVATILARHCVRCHNDDDRDGGFSLQSRASLVDSGFVVSGDRSSHLLAVMEPTEGEPPRMPKEADPVPAGELETIRRWIDAGAVWPEGGRIEQRGVDFDWWSFKPIDKPPVPATDSPWVRTPIDAFILARHAEHGLTHAEPADRLALIRRLTFDLIGLPPRPEEVDAFVADDDPRAYEKLVDRLLTSKHYGERWARHWLDVVKYADTCGYDKDKLRRNAWPYRDYVIRSFNQDKPYWRFVQEQIAGDALFPGQPDGILGLGFIAAGPWDFIGHVEVPESKIDGKVARNLDRDEMVTSTLNTFCSVTIQCARCHHHKFDPFTQEHYYSLQSIFAAVDRAERPYDLDPQTEQQRFELDRQLSRLRGQRDKLKKKIADSGGEELAKLNQQIGELDKRVGVVKEPAFGYHSAIADSPDVEKWVEVDLGREVDMTLVILRPCHDDFAGIGAGFGFPVRYRVEIRRQDTGGDSSVTVLRDATTADVPNPGLSPIEINGEGRSARYVRVRATRLAERKGDYMFALAEVEVIDRRGNNVAEGAAVSSLDSIEAPVRWGRRNLVDSLWPQYTDPEAAARLTAATAARARLLAKIETPSHKSNLAELESSIRDLESRLRALPKGKMVYAAATHFPPQGNFKPTAGTPRQVRLLHRGDVTQPRGAVTPGLLPLGEGDDWRLDAQMSESERRVALARWLTRKDHPLVWRSIVNRVWQYHFGRGLVASPNDFGRMGQLPTHPELLDWLAAEFRSGGQSLKQLHRLIVTSSVYRQSSQFNPSNAAIDSSNRYLWRMNRRRLSAEEIRDSILAVSGALDKTMGGPGFYLFELEKPEHSPHYEYHKFDPTDPASHRRSIYRFVVRSQPDPYMTTLDCADSSQSTPRRIETLTSLQALALLNNRFNLVMARRFAQRLRAEHADPRAQVDRAMMLVAGRTPVDQERKELIEYADRYGLENLCRMLMNLSEFVFVD